MEDVLKKIYFDNSNPASFSGVERLYRAAKKQNSEITRSYVKTFLRGIDSYTLHRPVRYKFKTRSIECLNKDMNWQADLSSLIPFKSYNDGHCYILFIIDVFTRFLWLIALKDKKPATVAKAFENIFERFKTQPGYLCVDQGSEFIHGEMAKMLKERHIGIINIFSVNKACIVERVQRTIKERLFRYFTYRNTHRYIDILDQICNAYNKSVHRITMKKPYDMYHRKEIVDINFKNPKTNKKLSPSILKVGDHVRVSHTKNIYTRGYRGSWSLEIFVIKSCSKNYDLYTYQLKDLNDENVKGSFYKQELQQIDMAKDKMYKIDKILSTHGRGRRKKYLVSWVGYPASFNSLVNACDINTIT